jgi:hypothetical protein
MNRTVNLLVTLALPLSLAAADDQSPLQVHEVWATTGSRSTPFGAIGGMIEGPNGEIFVSDQINVAVFSIQPQGMGVRQVARQGRGPGEVSTPGLMARTPNGGIAASVFTCALADVSTRGHDAALGDRFDAF